jgi:hypothetical protein
VPEELVDCWQYIKEMKFKHYNIHTHISDSLLCSATWLTRAFILISEQEYGREHFIDQPFSLSFSIIKAPVEMQNN